MFSWSLPGKDHEPIHGFVHFGEIHFGGSVVKNLPASAGDMGLIADPGRSHVLQSNKARAPQLLSLCCGAQELHC